MFAEAFTDRYSRDGLIGVRVPQLNPLVWRYAIDDAGDGAMVWRDGDGHLVAFNMVHRSGTEGWMGPLAVRPDRQSEGLGSTMVRLGIDWLRGQGCAVIGLETMPRTVDNIGFYSRLGLVPSHLTVTLVHDVPRRPLAPSDAELLSRGGPVGRSGDRRVPAAHPIASAWRGLHPRARFDPRARRSGTQPWCGTGTSCAGFALWHSTPLAAGRPKDELRVLKLVARDLRAFDRILDALPAAATGEKVSRVAIRCQTEFVAPYQRLVSRGYRVHWTDLRMLLPGQPSRPARDAIVMSNWEI